MGRQLETRKPTGPGLVTWILLGTGCIKIQEGGQAVIFGWADTTWTVFTLTKSGKSANHEAIAGYMTVTQCLVLTYNIWPEIRTLGPRQRPRQKAWCWTRVVTQLKVAYYHQSVSLT